jgi:hypothetical protein
MKLKSLCFLQGNYKEFVDAIFLANYARDFSFAKNAHNDNLLKN